VFQFARRNPGGILAGIVLLAGLVSGAVTIKADVLIFQGAILAFLAMRVLMVRDELEKQGARQQLLWAAVGCACFMLSSAMPQSLVQNWVAALFLLCVVMYGYYAIRWLLRSRWAGPLMVDLNRPRPKWLWWIASVTILSTLLVLVTARQPRSVLFSLGNLLFFLSMVIIAGRAEIRQRGLLAAGHLIPWSSVESYAWEPSLGEWEILRVRPKGFLRFLPAQRIGVQRQLKAKANEVLELQLSTWSG
jgi:hypothetical protein